MRKRSMEMSWEKTWGIIVAWAIFTALLAAGLSYEMGRVQDLNAKILALQQEKHATTDRAAYEIESHLQLRK